MDQTGVDVMLGGLGLVWLVICLATFVFGVYLYMRVASKAGWPGSYGLLMFIPVANIVFMLLYVFAPWPIEKELAALRAHAAATGVDPARFRQGYGA